MKSDMDTEAKFDSCHRCYQNTTTILILRMSSCIIISGIYSNIGYAVKSHLQCCLHNMLTTAGTNRSHENLENNPTLF